ncbi:hypothetical protein ILUMI_17937 [Ignelater luminosus]|uniref:Uncharacterized protein n=1 Tax=Ignelater luminosus TaxID=2038154 RepID=A0A8K0CNL3_IGNLU|nr:hypothetical protein ILUMI_17937 [Ignelater luminosus]
MACDMFSSVQAKRLLERKFIYFYGSSNIRALYKDLVWLLSNGSLTPLDKLKVKNEISYAGDIRVSNGHIHGGRNYEEVREYNKDPYIKFQFITRLNLPSFVNAVKEFPKDPDILVINSCVWDLSRWGSDGVSQFKENIIETFILLRSALPNTHIIWLTTFPINFNCKGGFLTEEIKFIRNMLPYHVVFANKYASEIANFFNLDVLDLHYHFRFLSNHHSEDGIHWDSIAIRYATNLLLTHIGLLLDASLPGTLELDQRFIQRSERIRDGRYMLGLNTCKNALKSRIRNSILSKRRNYLKYMENKRRYLC